MVHFHIHLCKRHISVYNLYTLTLIETILNPDSAKNVLISSFVLFQAKTLFPL